MPLASPLATPLGGDGTVGEVAVDHVSAAIDRLAFQFKDQPNMVGLIAQLAGQCVDIEAVIAKLQEMPSIDLAEGAQLDIIGRIVGEPRQGFDDGSYRLHLKARVWLNRGSGRPEDLYSMFRSLLGAGVHTWIEETYPASFIFHVDGAQLDATIANYFLTILQKAKAMGVWAFLHWLDAPPEQSFSFAGGPGLGFDGGVWSSVES